MAATRILLPHSSLAALIIFSLLFISVSAQVVPQQKPNLKAKPASPPQRTNVVPPKKNLAKFINDFVSAHNAVRVPIGLAPVKWNYTLAYFAKHWALKRVDDCALIHSYGPYGENLFWGGRTHWSPRAVVENWVEEKAFYNPISNTCKEGEMCGHFTQIIWRDSLRIGCARIKCNNNKGLYVICNYDPPGNYINENPFGNLTDAANLLKDALPLLS